MYLNLLLDLSLSSFEQTNIRIVTMKEEKTNYNISAFHIVNLYYSDCMK